MSVFGFRDTFPYLSAPGELPPWNVKEVEDRREESSHFHKLEIPGNRRKKPEVWVYDDRECRPAAPGNRREK